MLNFGELLGREGRLGMVAQGLGALVVVRTRLWKLSILSKICMVSCGRMGSALFLLGHLWQWQRLAGGFGAWERSFRCEEK